MVLKATELAGFLPTGEFTQLNSYENRVFDIRLEDPKLSRVIAKFYRPGRWSKDCILEEHQFLDELRSEGLTAINPLVQKNKSTLNTVHGMHVAFFPKVQGRMPEEFLKNDLKQVGRKLALLHNVGAQKDFEHRPYLGILPDSMWDHLDLLQEKVVPELWSRYEKAATEILIRFEDLVDPNEFLRIHGDCHRGNILSNGQDFFFVDFDDCMMGPAAQDFWMLFSSSDSKEEEEEIISGYEELREFPDHQLGWIPLLRGLRIISYAAWIARRWEDPSFPRLFPDFSTYTYWAEETEALEKIAWST